MPKVPRAVFFDVDGVLIDSLPQHLQMCRDKAAEFGLPIEIPDANRFREMIDNGVKVSPMLNFFLAVGFPPREAERAVADYEREFMALYRPAPFPGVSQMLKALRDSGVKLGLVTSNTRSNVAPALAAAMQCFEPQAVFFFDEYAPALTKSQCLAEGARRLNEPAGSCVYVGDQPADMSAAREAGLRFLGVTYGWGVMRDARGFETADSISGIARKLGIEGRLTARPAAE